LTEAIATSVGGKGGHADAGVALLATTIVYITAAYECVPLRAAWSWLKQTT
jgi:hypothetical protein